MRLFLSYAHIDMWQVKQLAELFETAGHTALFDERLNAGQDWKARLRELIAQCEAFVYVLSPESAASEWCQWELAQAVEQNKDIIAVLIRQTALPEPLKTLQHANMTQGPTPEAVARLLGGLTEIAVKLPQSAAENMPNEPKGKPARAESINKHVFLSYSRADTDIMQKVRDALREANVPVWTDESIITGDPSWKIAIEKAIENAGCMVVLMSPTAKDSMWVRKEIDYAEPRKIPITPALVRGTQIESIPYALSGMQYVNLIDNEKTGMAAIIASAQRQLMIEVKVETIRDTSTKQAVKAKFDEGFWDILFRVIRSSKCTLFLGPGINHNVLLPASEVAQQWAKQHQYPFASYDNDLARVAQFRTFDLGGPALAKEEVMEVWLKQARVPDMNKPDEAHSVLAQLNLPMYVTANYDDYMFQALQFHGKKPQRAYFYDGEWVYSQPRSDPTPATPMVFHLYGHQSEIESLILAEDDYLDYLMEMTQSKEKLPTTLIESMNKKTFLFIGFTVTDWNLRTLFRLLSLVDRAGRPPHIAVQIEPIKNIDLQAQEERIEEYLKRYFARHLRETGIQVKLEETSQFLTELGQRWKQENAGNV